MPTHSTLRVNIFNTSSNLPLFAAIEHGLFAQRGLTVEVQNTPNSDEQRAGLAAGHFDIAHAAVDNAVAMVEAGHPAVIVCGGDAGMNELMVRAEINHFDDLRGKCLAVDAPNTAYALVAKKILKMQGLLEGRDYQVKLAGGTGPRAKAMVADAQLAAGMINPPFSFTVRAQGLKSLGSQFDLLGPYQATGTFVMRAWAQANEPALVAYLAAYVEGQRHVLNPANRAAMVQLLMRRFNQTEAVAQSSYDALVAPGSGLAVDARFSPEGFATVLAIRAEMEGMWGGVPPAASKYVESLYFDRAMGLAGVAPPPQRLPYVSAAAITDPAMMAEFQRAAREGTPRPESHAIRAHVPAVFWAFANAWKDTFVEGVCDHAIKELCRLYVSQAVNCDYCGNQRSVKAQSQGLLEDDVKDLLEFEKSSRFTPRQQAALRLAEAITWGLEADDALWAGLYQHFETGQIVELGFFIGLTMGQQRWNRLINMQHGQFMGGQSGGLAAEVKS